MPKTGIPSPARSQGAKSTPRRNNPRQSRSMSSPTRSTTSGRISNVVHHRKSRESFAVSPLSQTVLTDNTHIEAPRRQSWWKKVDKSRDVIEILENERVLEPANVLDELNVEVLSQEKNNYSLDLPESSGSESINSIIVPHRRLFIQKENLRQNNYGDILASKQNTTSSDDKVINVGTKKLFDREQRASKHVFPSALLSTPDKTLPANKTKDLAAEIKTQPKSLFGNKAGAKRKNVFADFIVSESEDEIPEIQPKLFAFRKISEQTRRSSRNNRESSPASSVTTDMEMEDWKLLPSSTMVEHQLEANLTPGKKAKLSILSEAKESTNTDSTKHSNKSISSKNKSKTISPAKSQSFQKVTNIANDEAKETSNLKNQTYDVNKIATKQLSKQSISIPVNLEEKESTNTESTKHSNKSISSKNKSTVSPAKNQIIQNVTNIVNDEEKETSKLKNKTYDVNKTVTRQTSQQNISFPVNDEAKETSNLKNKTYDVNKTIAKQLTNSQNIIEDVQKITSEKEIPVVESGNASDEEEEITLTYDDNDPEELKLDDGQGISSNDKTIRGDNRLSKVSEYIDNINIELSKICGDDDHVLQIETPMPNKSVHLTNKIVEETPNSKHENVQNSDGRVEDVSRVCLILEGGDSPKNKKSKDSNVLEPKDNVDSVKDKASVNRLIVEHCTKVTKQTDMSLNVAEIENENIVFEIENADNHGAMHKAQIENNGEAGATDKNQNKTSEDFEVSPETGAEKELDKGDEKKIQHEDEHNGHEAEESHHEADVLEIAAEKSKHDGVEIENETEDSEHEADEVQNNAEESDHEGNEVDESEHEQDEVESEKNENELEEDDEKIDVSVHEQEEQDINESQEYVEDSGNQEVEHNEDTDHEDINQQDEENNDEEADNYEDQASDNEIQNESEEVAQDDNEEESGYDVSIQEENEQDNSQNQDNETEESDDQVLDDENVDSDQGVDGNVTHDTTGRNRHRRETDTPEAVMNVVATEMNSFTANGRNTSIRKTKSMFNNISLRPSIEPAGSSTVISTGMLNSTAEGSGWDSHRTTRKTLRQTFGKDFTPRKSLRALVMEKSAKRQTVNNENAEKNLPQANSTEITVNNDHMEYEDNEEIEVSEHEISRGTRQAMMDMYVQKVKKQNMEIKQIVDEQMKTWFQPNAPISNTFNFRMPKKPTIRRAKSSTQGVTKAKRVKLSVIPVENLPQEFIEDMNYKPPKRFRPSNAAWITKRLYKFLETKLEPKYDYKARVRAEALVEMIYNFVRDIKRQKVAPPTAVADLQKEMARLDVVHTHFEFYNFIMEYMPTEVKRKVVPDIINGIPLPRGGVFAPIPQ